MRFLKENIPKLDLHGEVREVVQVLVKDFIDEQVNLNNLELIIIHGKGLNIIKKEVHQILKVNQKVDTFYLSHYNEGVTLVILKEKQS